MAPAKKKAVSEKASPKPAVTKASLLTGWLDKWPDGKESGATAEATQDGLTITGNSNQMSYGNVYRMMTVDLDKTPYLVVDVNSVNGYWYLILKNENIKEGFVKVQQDDNSTGKQVYDLRSITDLGGKRDLEIDFGISSGKGEANTGRTVSIKEFKLTDKEPGTIPGALSLSPWKTKWPDGKFTGASVVNGPDMVTVTGTFSDQPFGSAYRIVTVNLDKTAYFKIAPSKVTVPWYLEASGGSLKSPVKIQPDTDSSDPKTYDLKTLLGLSGVQTFELHFGITSGTKDANTGKEVSFSKDMRFTSASADHQ